ncbi:MAG TPA: cation:proton antiporter [Myxococcota bacterium]|nr:cation:proton antiporter [Myxococcota bacterium]
MGDPHAAGHVDPFASVLLALVVVTAAALAGRGLAQRLKLAPVVGELTLGAILGNVAYQLGDPLAALVMHGGNVTELLQHAWLSSNAVAGAVRDFVAAAHVGSDAAAARAVSALEGPEGPTLLVILTALWVFSNLGVILLLLMVGLESSIEGLLRVGRRASAVAIAGVVAPFALGYGVSLWLLPDASAAAHLFLGATFTATSVGITARVLRDLGQMESSEAKVILGAAVIDDVLGLVILAVVIGIAQSGHVELGGIARIALLSAGFLAAVLFLGERVGGWIARALVALERRHAKLLAPLLVAFAMAWLVNAIGLASIVGAFAAGLMLRDEQFDSDSRSEASLHEVLAPLESIFAPIFFVLMGMQVNLSLLAEPQTLLLGSAFVAVAIASKLVTGLVAGPGVSKWSIGLGMVPRGEVGLIFASIGRQLGVVDAGVFSAVVLMVLATTLVAPLGLSWSLRRAG